MNVMTLQHLVRTMPLFTLYFIAITVSTLIILGFFLLALTKGRKNKVVKQSFDYEAIAGDDVMTTQLDLARAYLEMDKKPDAHKILKNVIKNGDVMQKKEAKRLLADVAS